MSARPFPKVSSDSISCNLSTPLFCFLNLPEVNLHWHLTTCSVRLAIADLVFVMLYAVCPSQKIDPDLRRHLRRQAVTYFVHPCSCICFEVDGRSSDHRSKILLNDWFRFAHFFQEGYLVDYLGSETGQIVMSGEAGGCAPGEARGSPE